MWVLSSNDRYNPLIPQLSRQALPASDLSLISNTTTANRIMPSWFGDEDRNSWCFFYEKADLARQSKDWETAINLYEESSSLGFSPANGVELIPFIEAYAYTGRADLAADLTSLAKDLTPDMRNYLCDTWNRIARDVVGDNLFNLEYQAISAQDLCWEVQ